MQEQYQQLGQFLRKYIEVSDELLELFCSKFKYRTTKRNEILVQEGDVCPYLYFVNKGCLRIYMMDVNGRESTRFVVTEGRFGTAFPSFTLQEPSAAAVQSIEPSEILCINRADYAWLIDNFPGYEHLYRITLEKDYIASIKRIESLITLDAKQRYELLMKSNPELIQRLPSKIIADYLNMSQETLSRLKSKK